MNDKGKYTALGIISFLIVGITFSILFGIYWPFFESDEGNGEVPPTDPTYVFERRGPSYIDDAFPPGEIEELVPIYEEVNEIFEILYGFANFELAGEGEDEIPYYFSSLSRKMWMFYVNDVENGEKSSAKKHDIVERIGLNTTVPEEILNYYIYYSNYQLREITILGAGPNKNTLFQSLDIQEFEKDLTSFLTLDPINDEERIGYLQILNADGLKFNISGSNSNNYELVKYSSYQINYLDIVFNITHVDNEYFYINLNNSYIEVLEKAILDPIINIYDIETLNISISNSETCEEGELLVDISSDLVFTEFDPIELIIVNEIEIKGNVSSCIIPQEQNLY